RAGHKRRPPLASWSLIHHCYSFHRIASYYSLSNFDWSLIKFMYSNQLGSKHNPHRGNKHSAPAPLAS
ncbi:hypothetical protein RSAG8_10600, partial [Rhizoctonia solani AG-8 WAC10335]